MTTLTYGTGRERLLAAAREVFAERGYRGAATRVIAERAGLTEPMLFRHFGSKAVLFEEAAVTPVVAFMDDYVAEWGAREHGSADAVEEVKDFTGRLIEVMRGDRELLVAILAAGQFDAALEPAAARLQAAFGRVITMFEGIVAAEFELRGLDTPDQEAFVRYLLAIVVAFGLHADWLQIGRGGVSLDRMLEEMARTTIYGVAGDGR